MKIKVGLNNIRIRTNLAGDYEFRADGLTVEFAVTDTVGFKEDVGVGEMTAGIEIEEAIKRIQAKVDAFIAELSKWEDKNE